MDLAQKNRQREASAEDRSGKAVALVIGLVVLLVAAYMVWLATQ